MTEAEYNAITEEYLRQKKRWESLKVGQIVYQSFPRFFDIEYYEHEILEIDIPNRVLKTKDNSQNGKIVELRGFQTTTELENEGIVFDDKK